MSYSTLLLDLFFCENLLEEILKNELLNHQFFKSVLFSVDVNIPSVIQKQFEVFRV